MATIVSVLAVDRLRRNLLRLASGGNWFSKGPDLLDRTDADAVGLAQSPIDRPGFGQFGAADEGRDVGRIGVAVADEAFASGRLKSGGP